MLKQFLRETDRELREIQKNINQNHVLHLPFPDKDLEKLLVSINNTLYEIRNERNTYAKRERDFQSQIEAVSHDLRTPLTVILGYLKLLKKQGLILTDDQSEMLNTTIHKAHVMEKLMEQFYDYSRLNAGDYKIPVSTIDVGKLLRETFVDNCLILKDAGLNADTTFPDCPVWITGNQEAFRRIFTNLLQNIGRYAYSYVKIILKQNDKQVHIIFENDTAKLSKQDIPYLFERFYMKAPARNQGGSGLGLTIAKSLTEEMGGTLEACITNKEPALQKNNIDSCIAIRFTLSLGSV